MALRMISDLRYCAEVKFEEILRRNLRNSRLNIARRVLKLKKDPYRPPSQEAEGI